MRTSLRARLLAAFGLVALPPLLLLGITLLAILGRSFEQQAQARLDSALAAATLRLDQLRARAEAQVYAITHEDLPGGRPPEDGERQMAEQIAARRGLEALEVVDAAGRVVSSAHYPAGLGLPDQDELVGGDPALRLETVGAGHGIARRLALMPAHPGFWSGSDVVVRGGPFLDGAFLQELESLTGAQVALRDTRRGRFIATPGSPLSSWPELALPDAGAEARGEIRSGTAGFLWAARRVRPQSQLWLVMALPRAPLDALETQLLRLTLGLSAAALAAALVFALLLSSRIARPVRELAVGARRVASGDLEPVLPRGGSLEIAELSAAFAAMTRDLAASRERLVRAERVAAWREMARRLAHEIKNPLFPIQLSVETLRRAYDDGRGSTELLRESSQTILEELTALRRIVDEFSQFARMPQPRLEPTDVNAVVEQVLQLYGAPAGGCRIEAELAGSLPRPPADRELLARALGNLVKNAIEAMPQGGTLRVRTGVRGSDLTIEVEDTGPGLSEEQRARLFTPYFTTKPGGTGLGLAIVQGIVADHGGRVEVRSGAGGTVFCVVLPAGAAGTLTSSARRSGE